MTPNQASGGQRRIVVAMDSNAESLTGLRRAAALAAELRIELAGLFLEDVNLLRMSELPGHEISLASGTRSVTSRSGMERQMRQRAATAQREVKRLAQAFSLSWSFEVRRAGVDSALREAAKSDELVCSALAPPALPHVAPRAADQGSYHHAPARRPRPVLALFEGGEHGARVLDLAARAAQINHQPLQVLVPARAGGAAEKAMAEAGRSLAGSEVSATVRRLPASERALLDALAAARGQLLFLDASGAAAGRLAALRSAAKCDLLLVSRR